MVHRVAPEDTRPNCARIPRGTSADPAHTRSEVCSSRRQQHPGLAELGHAGDEGACAHYGDPAYYNKAYSGRSQDVAFYVRMARQAAGPVLEYGIGSGRVAIPMARIGAEVTGVDLSHAMLSNLAERLDREPATVRQRIRWIHGDMRTVRLGRRFPLVIAPFNALLHLYSRSELEAFLSRVREHLAPEGDFIFDISVPQPGDLGRDPERTYGAPRFRYPGANQLVRYRERFEYDPLRQVLLVRMEFLPENAESWTVVLTHRQFFPAEIEALLHYNGFSAIEFRADFTEQLPDAGVDSLVVSCRLAPRLRTPRRWGQSRSQRALARGLRKP